MAEALGKMSEAADLRAIYSCQGTTRIDCSSKDGSRMLAGCRLRPSQPFPMASWDCWESSPHTGMWVLQLGHIPGARTEGTILPNPHPGDRQSWPQGGFPEEGSRTGELAGWTKGRVDTHSGLPCFLGLLLLVLSAILKNVPM